MLLYNHWIWSKNQDFWEISRKRKKLFLHGSTIISVNRSIAKSLLDFDCYDILHYKLNDPPTLKPLLLGKASFEIINIHHKNDNKNSFTICTNSAESGPYNICISFAFLSRSKVSWSLERSCVTWNVNNKTMFIYLKEWKQQT